MRRSGGTQGPPQHRSRLGRGAGEMREGAGAAGWGGAGRGGGGRFDGQRREADGSEATLPRVCARGRARQVPPLHDPPTRRASISGVCIPRSPPRCTQQAEALREPSSSHVGAVGRAKAGPGWGAGSGTGPEEHRAGAGPGAGSEGASEEGACRLGGGRGRSHRGTRGRSSVPCGQAAQGQCPAQLTSLASLWPSRRWQL